MELARHWAGSDGVPVVCLPSFSTDRGVTEAAFDQPLAAAGGLRRCQPRRTRRWAGRLRLCMRVYGVNLTVITSPSTTT